jgi:hypothetical protein
VAANVDTAFGGPDLAMLVRSHRDAPVEELASDGWLEDDGTPNALAGAWLVTLSGRTLSELRRAPAEGASFADGPTTDLDGDGVGEIVLRTGGGAIVVSGTDLQRFDETRFGINESLLPAGDADGDGRMDFVEVLGAWGTRRVSFRGSRGGVADLVDGDPLVEGREPTWFDVAASEDLDGDGHVDGIVSRTEELDADLYPWRWTCPRPSRITVWSGAWIAGRLAR